MEPRLMAGTARTPRPNMNRDEEDDMRSFHLWRLWSERRRRTSSSETPPSAGTGAAAPTADATCPKHRLAIDPHRNDGRWTTPSGRRGSAPTQRTGRLYRSRSATPDGLARVRRIAGDIAAIVLIVSATVLLIAGIILLASMIGTIP
jgi:hypothetical protein